MTRKRSGNLQIIDQFYNQIPAFTDVFSEDTFYIFVVCFVLSTIVVVVILSRFITLKPLD